MAKQQRKLAGFNDLASRKENINDNVNINKGEASGKDTEPYKVNENINVNDNINDKDSLEFVRSLAEKPKKKAKDPIKPTGIYFNENNLILLKRLSENGGRGTQSKIINLAAEEFFKKAGLMDEEGNIID
ncbi:hypothetical protein ACQKFO_22935 [Rossellomorea sp. NPDC071047]|uniref:hypothetical protein n=1 Tax=Rossellomorea sp. NPDC071047 TaxID=3390675 RepID=UPI003CFF3C45